MIMDVIIQFWKLNMHISCALCAGRQCRHVTRSAGTYQYQHKLTLRPLGLQYQALQLHHGVYESSRKLKLTHYNYHSLITNKNNTIKTKQ